YFFFFQAEDGIRDGHVTGVQTCALPIFGPCSPPAASPEPLKLRLDRLLPGLTGLIARTAHETNPQAARGACHGQSTPTRLVRERSEERRVGKGGRGGWTSDHSKEMSTTI